MAGERERETRAIGQARRLEFARRLGDVRADLRASRLETWMDFLTSNIIHLKPVLSFRQVISRPRAQSRLAQSDGGGAPIESAAAKLRW